MKKELSCESFVDQESDNIISKSVKLYEDNRMFPDESMYCEGRYKPLLRGYFHASGLLLLVPLCIFIMWEELNLYHEFFSVLMMASGSLVCWGASALFHCISWDLETEIQFQKIDHSAIFVKIAAIYTSIALLLLHQLPMYTYMITVSTIIVLWLCSVLGIWHVHNRREDRIKFWVGMVCLSFPSYFFLSEYVTLTERSYAMLGIVCYCIGAVFFSMPSFDLIPKILGNHEIFHLFTLFAAICTYILIHSMCSELPTRCENNQNTSYAFSLFKTILSHTISSTQDICNP